MQHINGWVENGNTKVSVSGLLSTTLTQKSFPLSTVTVYNSGTINVAQIFSDNAGTPLGNPFTATVDGLWGFFAAPGSYDVVFSGTGISAPFTLIALGNSITTFLGPAYLSAADFVGSDASIQINAAIAALPASGGVVDARSLIGNPIALSTITLNKPTTLLLPLSLILSGNPGIRVSSHGCAILGQSQHGTIVTFNPSTTATAILLENSDPAVELAQGVISGFTLDAIGNSQAKTGIEIIDAEEYAIHDIAVSNWTDGLKLSIGINLKGRQSIDFDRITIFADTPVRISKNPNHPGIDCDHCHFSNCQLGADSNPNILADDGVNITNLTIDGYQAWVKGTYGFKYSSTTDTVAGFSIHIQNARWEQGTGVGGFGIYLSNLNGFRNVNLVNNGAGGASLNGYYLKDIAAGAMVGCSYSSIPAGIALQTVGDVRMSFIGNDLTPTGGTFSFAANSMIDSVWMNNDGVSSVGLGVPNPTNQFVIPNNTALAALNFTGSSEIVMVEVNTTNNLRVAPGGQTTLIGGVVQIGTGAGLPSSHQLVLPNSTQYSGMNVGNTDSIAIVGVTNTNTLIFDASGVGSRFGGQVILNLPIFANNAAAVGGGLAVGMLYRTGADPDPVSIVHP